MRTNVLSGMLPLVILFSSSGARPQEPTDVSRVIADATSAAPPYISKDATVVGQDMRVLRRGSAEWTCMPSRPGAPSPNPMCADSVTLRFFDDIRAGKKSNITRVGIAYMLRGETGADFNDVLAKEPPPGKDWYHAGPHVMFVFPAAATKLLEGMPQNPSNGEPYVRPMPNGNAAILVVPVAKPHEEIRTIPPGERVRHRNESRCAEPSISAKRSHKHQTRPPETLVARVRGEFFEMPGLRLTCEQACRLWQVNVSMCETLLEHLVREGTLCKTDSGFYVASEMARRRRP